MRLNYLDWRNDDAPPLVLIHGIHGHAHAWDELSSVMQERFHVLALDMRGHGDSEWASDGDYEGQTLLADLAAFIERLQLKNVTLVGESLGGIVAFAYAAMNPALVNALAVVDVGPEINPEGLQEIRQSASTRPTEFAHLGQALMWSRREVLVPMGDAIAHRLRYNLKETEGGRLTWKYDPRVDSVTSSSGSEGDALMWQLWSAIKCPTLILRGDNSKLLTEEAVEKMLAACPSATLRTVPDAGHAVMVDNQAAFISETSAFLLMSR